MIFLKTTDKMYFEDYKNYDIFDLKITNEQLDDPMSKFIGDVREMMIDVPANDTAVLINVNVDDIDDDDIEYTKHFIVEVIVEALCGEKLNDDWQPRSVIVNGLDATMRAQTMLQNYDIEPKILNIFFVKNNQIVYELVKEK